MMNKTAIFDDSGNSIFETAGIMKVTATPESEYSSHTLEDGTTVSDNKIRRQTRVTIEVILNTVDYVSVYQQIKSAEINNTKFTIQTKTDTFNNMYITSYPNDESVKMFDTVSLTIGFVEQQFVKVEFKSMPQSRVKNKSNSDTVKRGEQENKKGSLATKIFDSIKS